MGVNLRPSVDTFSISVETFGPTSHDVQDGCVTPGTHRVMRFNFFVHNIGNADLNIGKPSANMQMFEFSAAHGHYHMKTVGPGGRVAADLRHPDGTHSTLALAEVDSGIFETSLQASAEGVYAFHVAAEGNTRRGRLFTREQWLTGMVWHGGDRPAPTIIDDPNFLDPGICRLINCVLEAGLKSDELQRELRERGLNLRAFRDCLDGLCGAERTPAPPAAGTSRQTRRSRTTKKTFGEGPFPDPKPAGSEASA